MIAKGAVEQATTAARLIVFVVVVLLATVAGTIWLLFDNAQQTREDLIQIYEQLLVTNQLFSALQDAETGQRGFLLARDPAYLLPYETAVGRVQPLLDAVAATIIRSDAASSEGIHRLQLLVNGKLNELAETIRLEQSGRHEEALALVRSDNGSRLMNGIRQVLGQIEHDSRTMLAKRTTDFRDATVLQVLGTVLIVALLFAVLIGAGVLLRRAFRSLRAAEALAESNAERLRVSFDSLSQGISVFDAERGLVIWNYCFAELFSVPDHLLGVGTPYGAFVRHNWMDEEGDFLETPEQIGAAPPETIGRLSPIVYERTRKDGRTFELRRTALPSGGFVITYTDVTQRLSTEQQLRQAQRLEAVGQLTGGIAHDFNNLLTVVIGNLDLLRKRSDLAQGRGIEMALAAAERGASLTRQMLAFARQQPLEPRPINVNRLLSDLGGFLQRSLGEQIKVETVTAAGLWTVLADASQLENAILNLALNARDAMPQGGPLTIEAANAALDLAYARSHAEVQAGPYVMIAVTDNGSGMTPDIVSRAFDPFFTTKGEGKGSGLGLSQVFGFVKQSGGHVKIYSEVGSGTTVKLYLPRTTQPAVQAARPPEEVTGGHETVLIVEDDRDVRRVAAAMLSELGYKYVEASDAEQALKLLTDETAAVDVMFTDVILPGGMFGRELAIRAQMLNPWLRILYTSGYTQNAIIHNAKVDDDVVFLSKPYKKTELAQKLRQILDMPVEDTRRLAQPASGRPAVLAKPRTIVVVEDELLVLWFALDLVRSLGHEPLEASNAAEALALFGDGARSIDAMVTDLGLPDMPGDELVLHVRARRPDLPIIIATGYGEAHLSALSGVGRIAYLSKPYDVDRVREALARVGL